MAKRFPMAPGQTKPAPLLFIATFALRSGKLVSVNIEAQTWHLAAKKALVQLPVPDNCGAIIPVGSTLIAMTQRRSISGICSRCDTILFSDDRPKQRGDLWYCDDCR